MTRAADFHISNFPANDIWPEGGWSLYQISGDEIAQRVAFDKHGFATRRDSWCGYIGCFTTLAEVTTAIEERMAQK